MEPPLGKKIDFRLQQSEEKLKLSSLMIKKGQYNDSIIFSYLSLFYSVRILLIKHDEDSDDYGRIHELMEKYYQPTGWTNLNIIEIIKETREFKDMVELNTGVKATRKEAEKFNRNASDVLGEMRKQCQLLSETHTPPSE
jgi:uncharacterized protein (UPF0332 family)